MTESNQPDDFPDVIARLALIGRHTMMPGIKPVLVDGRTILVAHAYAPKIVDEFRNFEIDTEDCTIFTLTHRDAKKNFDVENVHQSRQILDDSLKAVSESLLWERAHEKTGNASPFQRRVGRVDAKFFSIDGPEGSDVVWRNPGYQFTLDAMSLMAGFMSNMIMSNGPAANPLPADSKRMMSAIDLVNLGFFTEAFVAGFALLDDLAQRVIAGGLDMKGLGQKEKTEFLRAVKENRLNHFLNTLTKLCDWVGLKEHDSNLNGRIAKVNSLRNSVMHGDRELSRVECLDALDAILGTIAYLRGNPFSVEVVDFPPLRPADPQLIRVTGPFPDPPQEDGAESDQAKPEVK